MAEKKDREDLNELTQTTKASIQSARVENQKQQLGYSSSSIFSDIFAKETGRFFNFGPLT